MQPHDCSNISNICPFADASTILRFYLSSRFTDPLIFFHEKIHLMGSASFFIRFFFFFKHYNDRCKKFQSKLEIPRGVASLCREYCSLKFHAFSVSTIFFFSLLFACVCFSIFRERVLNSKVILNPARRASFCVLRIMFSN